MYAKTCAGCGQINCFFIDLIIAGDSILEQLRSRMQLFPNLIGKKLILASASPRRQQLLKGLEIEFEVIVKPTDESFPSTLKRQDIPLHIAHNKAQVFDKELAPDEIVITADTVVWINEQVINKPSDRKEAISMLASLSGNFHHVYTGVCIKSREKETLFYDETKVYFNKLSTSEIEHYVDSYQPYDKAGSYGAQDWIGLIAIHKLEGSYFNVMGLPVHLLYAKLKAF